MDDRAERASRRSLGRSRAAGASKKTVYFAIAANSVIAIAKFVGGAASGSTAMLAEGAHSVADTTNQCMLLLSIRLSGREPDPERPFGHGQERFLWTLLAATGMFVAGAVFAIGYGVFELLEPSGEKGGFGIAYAVLGIALVAEGISWLRALHQTRREAREAERPMLRHVRGSRDPNVKMVLFEDSAALIGVVLATGGVALHQVTGTPFWDPAASILIGLLLVAVAVWMGRDAGHLVTGAAARPEERDAIERTIESFGGVVEVQELLTMALGPDALLVAARVDLEDDLGSDRVEELSNEIDERLREVVPDVTEVFLDATPSRPHDAELRDAASR
jgi:cation diffusion facilitator family transporter